MVVTNARRPVWSASGTPSRSWTRNALKLCQFKDRAQLERGMALAIPPKEILESLNRARLVRRLKGNFRFGRRISRILD
jgi:hypothetical protein